VKLIRTHCLFYDELNVLCASICTIEEKTEASVFLVMRLD